VLHIAQGLQLEPPKLLHEVLQGEALLGLDLSQAGLLAPGEIAGPEDLRIVIGRGVLPVMGPQVDRRAAGIIAPTLLDVFRMGEARQGLLPRERLGEIDGVPGGDHAGSSTGCASMRPT
jgi:hypothetical protein